MIAIGKNLLNQINVQSRRRNNRRTFFSAFEMSDTVFVKNYSLNKKRGEEAAIPELSV